MKPSIKHFETGGEFDGEVPSGQNKTKACG